MVLVCFWSDNATGERIFLQFGEVIIMMCFGGKRRPRQSHVQWGDEDCLISVDVTRVANPNAVDAGNKYLFKGELPC